MEDLRKGLTRDRFGVSGDPALLEPETGQNGMRCAGGGVSVESSIRFRVAWMRSSS